MREGRAAIYTAPQIDSTDDKPVWICRVHPDAVAVPPLIFQVLISCISTGVTPPAIGRAIHLTRVVVHRRIHDARIPRGVGNFSAPGRKARSLCPSHAAVAPSDASIVYASVDNNSG